MMTIRKNNIRKNGNSITIELPENFPGEAVDVIVMPSEELADSNKTSEIELQEWRKELLKFCGQFSIDLSKYPFNREELYDRF